MQARYFGSFFFLVRDSIYADISASICALLVSAYGSIVLPSQVGRRERDIVKSYSHACCFVLTNHSQGVLPLKYCLLERTAAFFCL